MLKKLWKEIMNAGRAELSFTVKIKCVAIKGTWFNQRPEYRPTTLAKNHTKDKLQSILCSK